ncbi:hypothetical protein MMIC_P1235 [Mariprofundus micogutta]|uniref:Uncharacterized protein n=1 Tax=Mariprofundus micogutta TaxID=1921010 RepID=A0A1L8CMY2_9PROT|nr:hypothetical protein [Mariprofundus micogutta]GAV20271.1 hypothetical protein MMIC_P1235 [Mariprofundus micogutta]
MKVSFSIDALSPSGAKAWRLLENDGWRECIYAETLKDGDARITDKKSAEDWAGRRMKKDKQHGLIPQQKAGTFDFLMRGIFAHAVLHRESSAPVPAKEQMIQCFAAHKSGTPWLIYLNVAGHFAALDTSKVSIITNLDIAVRAEITSGDEYIGPKAAAKETMMNEIYKQFLAGWLDHLNSSNMNVFVPDPEKLKDESVYIELIRDWQSEQY